MRPAATRRGDTAATARAIHAHRALESAIDHGIALLAVLGLPRVVTPDFEPVDPDMIGDAISAAIAILDEADAPGEDLEDEGHDEPSLGWIARMGQGCLASGGTADLERDTADGEPWLASPERHPAVPFSLVAQRLVDRSPNARQTRWADGAQHDGERQDEDGDALDEGELDTSDHEPSLGALCHVDQTTWSAGRASDVELDPLDCIEASPGESGLRHGDPFALAERARALCSRTASSRSSTTTPKHHRIPGLAPAARSTGDPAHA